MGLKYFSRLSMVSIIIVVLLIFLSVDFPTSLGLFITFLFLNIGKTGPSFDIGSLYIDSIS